MPFMLPVFSRKTVSGGHFNNDETYQSPGAKHLVIMGCRIKLFSYQLYSCYMIFCTSCLKPEVNKMVKHMEFRIQCTLSRQYVDIQYGNMLINSLYGGSYIYISIRIHI